MSNSIWNVPLSFSISTPPPKSALKTASAQVSQVLKEVGENSLAINTLEMEKRKLKPHFKDFNPEQVTPERLRELGLMLFNSRFIDNHTAELMSRVGEEFDSKGKVINPDKQINALEFLATRIIEMKDKAAWGDPYAKTLLPDYIRTIHILQNLEAFGRSGDSMDLRKFKAQERAGTGTQSFYTEG